MSTVGFAVEMETLRSLANEMLESLEAFDKNASDLNASMMALSAQWEGPANESFRVAFARDYHQTLQDIRLARSAIQRILEDESRYRETEEKVHSLVEGIQI